MRIGFDATVLGVPGGIQLYARCLLASLARLCGRHSLVLWCGSRPAGPAMRQLAPTGARVVAPGPAGRLLARWGRLARGNPFPIEMFAGPVDVFHGPNYMLPAQRGKAALVVTVHDLSVLRYPQWHPARRVLAHRLALRRTVRAVDHVITDTETIRDEVIADLGVNPEQVTAIPLALPPSVRHGAPAELRAALDRWGLSPREYFLFAGAIEPRKNLGRLLDAMTALRARRRGVPPLILVGPPGWRNREIRDRLAGAGPCVRYLGFVPPQDLATLMAGSAAFLLPSLYEGFGLPVLEAMACGVPVVTSRGGALEEVAGAAALLVDPRDVEAIAAGIERALDDTTLREALIRLGLARAAQFSWDRAARETLRVYERAIAARG